MELQTTPKYFLTINFTGIRQTAPIQFADDAAKSFCWVRDTYGFGASDMKKGCGDIKDADGKLVGRISYNGRIWDASGKPFDGLNGQEWIAQHA